MNPIPTTNAMKPAAGKGIPSFPTPVIKDTVIVEVVNAWKGDYTPLEYGAKWDDHPHASVQGSFPDHKLISQTPNSEDGQWVKRIWANDRADQDTYNYAIKYSGGSDAHPIYIRTYLEPRETYAPVADLTPDPLFPGAFLVEEEVTRTEGEFDSRYVQVTRVYETLPGPVISSKRYNDRGDIETVNTQTVPPGTLPDPDGLLVTQSQVILEDVSKGTKTTATVPSHSILSGGESKSGLLGRTSSSDEIVSPGTPADSLTFTGSGGVIDSSVTPISATKSKKTSITSFGPVELESDSLVDSPLGLVKAKVSESIVDPTTQPVSSELQGNITIRDSIKKLDEVKSQRETIQVEGNWPENVGVDYDEQLGIGIYYTQTIKKPSDYINPPYWADLSYKEYKPIDQWKSVEKSYDIDKINEALTNQYYKIPTQIEIRLPDKLKTVTAYYGRSFGAGQSSGSDSGASTGSYNKSLNTNIKSSESINGDIYFEVEAGFSGAADAFTHIFFLKITDGRIDTSNILETLNNFAQFGQATPPKPPNNAVVVITATYKKWPYLKTKTENIILISGSKSETQSTSRSESANINGFSESLSEGSSFDVDVNVNSINIPTTLHPAITITEQFIGAGGNLGPTYGVRPQTISATEPSVFPTGNYLYAANVELYKYGFVKVTATTVEIGADKV
jgi:hypothetical protein